MIPVNFFSTSAVEAPMRFVFTLAAAYTSTACINSLTVQMRVKKITKDFIKAPLPLKEGFILPGDDRRISDIKFPVQHLLTTAFLGGGMLMGVSKTKALFITCLAFAMSKYLYPDDLLRTRADHMLNARIFSNWMNNIYYLMSLMHNRNGCSLEAYLEKDLSNPSPETLKKFDTFKKCLVLFPDNTTLLKKFIEAQNPESPPTCNSNNTLITIN